MSCLYTETELGHKAFAFRWGSQTASWSVHIRLLVDHENAGSQTELREPLAILREISVIAPIEVIACVKSDSGDAF
jgi:hypothetical protein